MAPNAQSQDPEAGDLARLPELRHYRRRLQDPSMHLRISPTTCLLVLSADKRTLCDAPSTANWKSADQRRRALLRPSRKPSCLYCSVDPVHNDDFACLVVLLQRLIKPRRSPITTAWVRSRALNFCMICLTWTLTVSSAIKSRAPMSRFR